MGVVVKKRRKILMVGDWYETGLYLGLVGEVGGVVYM